jgi:hypothetical protein
VVPGSGSAGKRFSGGSLLARANGSLGVLEYLAVLQKVPSGSQ